MSKEIQNATTTIKSHTANLSEAIKKNDMQMIALRDSVKKASQESRKACNDGKQALEKLDASINIEKLLRIADTMERIAKAMNDLSLIEQNGKLERIINAVK